MYHLAKFERRNNKGYETSAWLGAGSGLGASSVIGYGAYKQSGNVIDKLKNNINKPIKTDQKIVDQIKTDLSESKDTTRPRRFDIDGNIRKESRNSILDLFLEKTDETNNSINENIPKYQKKASDFLTNNKRKVQKITGLGVGGAVAAPLIITGVLGGMGLNYYRNKWSNNKRDFNRMYYLANFKEQKTGYESLSDKELGKRLNKKIMSATKDPEMSPKNIFKKNKKRDTEMEALMEESKRRQNKKLMFWKNKK